MKKFVQNVEQSIEEILKPFSREETRKTGQLLLFVSFVYSLLSWKIISIDEYNDIKFKNIEFIDEVVLIICIYYLILYLFEITVDLQARKSVIEVSEINDQLQKQVYNSTLLFNKLVGELNDAFENKKNVYYKWEKSLHLNENNGKDELERANKGYIEAYKRLEQFNNSKERKILLVKAKYLNKRWSNAFSLTKIRYYWEVVVPILFSLFSIFGRLTLKIFTNYT